MKKPCKHLHFYNTISVSHQVMKSYTHTCGLHAHLNIWAKYRKYVISSQVQRQQVWVLGQGNSLNTLEVLLYKSFDPLNESLGDYFIVLIAQFTKNHKSDPLEKI